MPAPDEHDRTTQPEPGPPPPVPAPPGWCRDFLDFLWQARLWWIVPLLIMVGLIVCLAWLSREPQRPPTYPSF